MRPSEHGLAPDLTVTLQAVFHAPAHLSPEQVDAVGPSAYRSRAMLLTNVTYRLPEGRCSGPNGMRDR